MNQDRIPKVEVLGGTALNSESFLRFANENLGRKITRVLDAARIKAEGMTGFILLLSEAFYPGERKVNADDLLIYFDVAFLGCCYEQDYFDIHHNWLNLKRIRTGDEKVFFIVSGSLSDWQFVLFDKLDNTGNVYARAFYSKILRVFLDRFKAKDLLFQGYSIETKDGGQTYFFKEHK